MGAGYHGGFGNTKGSAHNNESANTPKKESRADLISELRKNKSHRAYLWVKTESYAR